MTDVIDGEVLAEEEDRLPVVRAEHVPTERSVDELVARADLIRDAADRAMVEDYHYGKIPGTDKRTLLKPGAEKLCLLFRLAPTYESTTTWHEGDHMTVVTKCRLVEQQTGALVAEAEGLCSTKEKKYAVRRTDRLCPECGGDFIKRSKFPDKETGDKGWYCFKRIGGCGAEFASSDRRIADQEVGEKPNPELPDTWNTVLKMSAKRALVAAVLNGTAASEVFTQDVEDADTEERTTELTEVRPAPGRAPKAPRSWAECQRRLAAALDGSQVYGEDDVEAAKVWIGQALDALYGDGVRPKGQDGKVALQRIGSMVMRAEDELPAGFPPPTRAQVRAALAGALDGLELEGPAWDLGDAGEDRLDYWTMHGKKPPAGPREHAAATPDDVEF